LQSLLIEERGTLTTANAVAPIGFPIDGDRNT
jgi:hypothetical protein